MALDPTASEFFFRSSIKKYLIDTLHTVEGLLVIFDGTILYDAVSSYNVSEWIVVNFGVFVRDKLSKNIIEINCCTRKDAEGVELSKLTDTVVDNITDRTNNDGLQRISLYDSTDADPTNWAEFGKMLVVDIIEGRQNTTPDQTKVKTITVVLTWGTII